MNIVEMLASLVQDPNNIELKAALAEALKVESLILRLSSIRNPFTFLAQGLLSDTTLTSLDIGSSRIGNEGATAIVPWLSTSSTLTYLSLADNEIQMEGIEVLARALFVNKGLTELDLSANRLKEGAHTLAKALESNSTLKVLKLASAKIGNSGALAILKSLKIHPELTFLDLSINRVTDEGVEAIANTLEINTKLRYLNLSINRMSSKGPFNNLIINISNITHISDFPPLRFKKSDHHVKGHKNPSMA